MLGASVSAGDALPYTFPAYEVEVETDVVYCSAEGYWTEGPDRMSLRAQRWYKLAGRPHELSLKMDIYKPAGDGASSRPLLLMMHGGSYAIGSKSEKGQTEWCRYFASLGYVAASIDYRLGFRPSAGGLLQAEADATDDARAALAYLLGREDLRADSGRVFAAGTSAGGTIALGLAYGTSCHILAAGNLWGYVRNLSVLENARVPIVSFQSVRDPVVPYGEGLLLGLKMAGTAYGTKAVHDRATELGIPCEHVPCPEKHHRLHLDGAGVLTPRFYEIRDTLAAFFAGVMAGDEKSLTGAEPR